MRANYIIQHGRVIDPAAQTDICMDIAVLGDRIISAQDVDSAERYIDATGCWVLPGLIDFHTHLFYGASTFGTRPDLLLPTGVTTAVDMGSCGRITFLSFLHSIVQSSLLPIQCFLNVSPLGQLGKGIYEPLERSLIHREEIFDLVQKYPDIILGIKVRMSKSIVGELGVAPLQSALEVAEQCRLPVCVHVTDAPISMGDLADMLRPGDIFSHVFHGVGNTILEHDTISPSLYRARQRGVLFDLGNGNMNFSFQVAQAAAAQNFWPDTISSDCTPATLFRSPAMKDLPFVMSKLICLGMPVTDVIRAVTATPAKLIHKEGVIGTLAPGSLANVAIFAPKEGPVTFYDSAGTTMAGDFQLLHRLTLLRGQVCACASDFTII